MEQLTRTLQSNTKDADLNFVVSALKLTGAAILASKILPKLPAPATYAAALLPTMAWLPRPSDPMDITSDSQYYLWSPALKYGLVSLLAGVQFIGLRHAGRILGQASQPLKAVLTLGLGYSWTELLVRKGLGGLIKGSESAAHVHRRRRT